MTIWRRILKLILDISSDKLAFPTCIEETATGNFSFFNLITRIKSNLNIIDARIIIGLNYAVVIVIWSLSHN
jgi:hypothetical protein